MKTKIAIVSGGGGMKCAYSAGALYALAKELNFTEPDIIVGSSGSISFTYYVSGQYESIKNIWTKYLISKKFISLRRLYRIMDIDYMVDVIFKKQDPLNTENITKSKTRLFFCLTNYITGNPEYFTNDGKIDMFEIMRATTAVPLIFNKKIKINNSLYIDGDISSSVDKNIQKAINEGAKKILVIQDAEGQSIVGFVFWKFASFFSKSRAVRKDIGNIYVNNNMTIPEGVEVYTIRPDRETPAGYLDDKKSDLQKTFAMGYVSVLADEKLKEFLSESQIIV